MIKDIVKENFLLCQESKPVREEDKQVLCDLKDTLEHHKNNCVGMAANMIGICKRVIAFYDEGKLCVMINPELLKCEKPYTTSEGCLCHEDEKEVRRFQNIKVAYLGENFKKKIKSYRGFSAQIIQHELDHLEGILI